MKGIKEANTFYIITFLLSAALLFPLFMQSQPVGTLQLNEQTITASIIKSFPLMAVLLFISLYGTAEDRNKRGWNTPVWKDLPVILVFSGITFLLSFLFPASDKAYIVNLYGTKALLVVIPFALVTAFTEELFFRSWLITGLKAYGWPQYLVFLLPVVFFAFLHLWQGLNGFIFALLSASMYTYYFLHHPRLFTIIASHTIHNALALIMMARK